MLIASFGASESCISSSRLHAGELQVIAKPKLRPVGYMAGQ
jgi:hypothetical protein